MSTYALPEKLINDLNSSEEELFDLLRTLAPIPAPSTKEDRRAAFCKDYFEKIGIKNVYIDKAKNVVCPINCENAEKIVLFSAHTDVVFPDEETLPFCEDDEYFCCPGIGDDTACLAHLMIALKKVINHNLTAKCGVLVVANSCEEGLGNLEGIKQIIKDYPNISEVYAFDWQYGEFVNKCVGSHRVEIRVKTEGGHSFGNFGRTNAIAVLSELITSLYSCSVPTIENSKTTYNVGLISGGTSVNTIAQNASCTYEYRSDNEECLAIMQDFFDKTVEKARKTHPDANFELRVIGKRPCGAKIDKIAFDSLCNKVKTACETYTHIPCTPTSGSTDCNIPASLGIPAVCVGTYIGNGAHTREEKVLKSSLLIGLKIVTHLLASYFE